VSAHSIDNEHPKRKQDTGPQLRNLKDILEAGKKSLKHRR